MSGSVLQDCLNSENILRSGEVTNEGRKSFDESTLAPEERQLFARYLRLNPRFSRLWNGLADAEIDITLRPQVRVENGVIYYNGKKYNKDTWTNFFVVSDLFYGPPKFIRLQGRMAKEIPNPLNSISTEVVELESGQLQRVRRVCSCGGRLVYGHDLVLYCEKCKLVDE